jgi:hypothetical protein
VPGQKVELSASVLISYPYMYCMRMYLKGERGLPGYKGEQGPQGAEVCTIY